MKTRPTELTFNNFFTSSSCFKLKFNFWAEDFRQATHCSKSDKKPRDDSNTRDPQTSSKHGRHLAHPIALFWQQSHTKLTTPIDHGFLHGQIPPIDLEHMTENLPIVAGQTFQFCQMPMAREQDTSQSSGASASERNLLTWSPIASSSSTQAASCCNQQKLGKFQQKNSEFDEKHTQTVALSQCEAGPRVRRSGLKRAVQR